MRPSRRSSIRTSTLLATYNNTVVGQTTVPIDTLQAFTQETNGANLQADASVCELAHAQHHRWTSTCPAR